MTDVTRPWVRATPYTASVSTKAIIVLLAAMFCVTILAAARILDDPDPASSPATVTFCPPRLRPC